MVEGVWGLCGPGRRGHTLLPRMRTFCRGGAGFRAVASPGGREQCAQRRSRFGQEEPLAAAGTVFFSTSIRVVS